MGQPSSPQILGLFDPTRLVAGMLIEVPFPVLREKGKRRIAVAPIRGVVTSVDVPQHGDVSVALRELSPDQKVRWGISNFEPRVTCNYHRSVKVLEIEP